MGADSESTSSREEEDSEEVDAAVAIAKAFRRKRGLKRDLSRGGPLRAGLQPTARPANSEEALLQECEALYAKLPKNSKYAQHKLKVLGKAIELLRKKRTARTQEETDELQGLLKTLKLGSMQTATAVGAATAAAAAGAAAGAAADPPTAMQL